VRPIGSLLTLFFTGGCALVLGCASPEEPRDILLISIDTLRSDHLGIYGYRRSTSPQIDRWFADGAIFESAYATEASTPPSVVSLLSGLLPQDHGVRLFYQLLEAKIPLLPDLLPERYQTAAVVSNMVLTDEAMGLAHRFDHFDDHVDAREPHRPIFERVAGKTTDAALRWLHEDRNPEQPLFLWVHYIDPHGPYRPPEPFGGSLSHEGRVRLEPRRVLRYQREPGVTDALDYVDRYDEEVAYLDAHVGRLLDGYAARWPIDAALVVFTADHGESMLEHERWFTHGYHVYEEIVRVPLMLRGPGVRPGRFAMLASGIDLAPTLLRFAGAALPAGLSGRDLRRASRELDGRVVFSEASSGALTRRTAIRGREKWIVTLERGTRPSSLLYYALDEDPAELSPAALSLPSRGDAVQQLLELVETDPDPRGASGRKGRKITAPKVDPRADAEALERLRALGYVE
jgi:arylsulfatase